MSPKSNLDWRSDSAKRRVETRRKLSITVTKFVNNATWNRRREGAQLINRHCLRHFPRPVTDSRDFHKKWKMSRFKRDLDSERDIQTVLTNFTAHFITVCHSEINPLFKFHQCFLFGTLFLWGCQFQLTPKPVGSMQCSVCSTSVSKIGWKWPTWQITIYQNPTGALYVMLCQ